MLKDGKGDLLFNFRRYGDCLEVLLKLRELLNESPPSFPLKSSLLSTFQSASRTLSMFRNQFFSFKCSIYFIYQKEMNIKLIKILNPIFTVTCQFCCQMRVLAVENEIFEFLLPMASSLESSVKQHFKPDVSTLLHCSRCKRETEHLEDKQLTAFPDVLVLSLLRLFFYIFCKSIWKDIPTTKMFTNVIPYLPWLANVYRYSENMLCRVQYNKIRQQHFKCDDNVAVPLDLSLTQFCYLQPENKALAESASYCLKSAAVHVGSEPFKGHYYTIQCHGTKWMCYNDNIVCIFKRIFHTKWKKQFLNDLWSAGLMLLKI